MSSSEMTRIAVLVMDDNAQDANDLARLIESSPCARKAGFELALEVRAGGVDELEHIVAAGLPDIAFVDIRLSDEAGAPTGIDVVESVFAGTAVQVVYVSAYDSYHTQVYRTEHASFVKKPAFSADVDAALGHALKRLRERRLGAAGVVGARGVEVVKAAVEEGVHHLRERGDVDGAVLELGQAHAAEAELALRILERRDVRGL